MSSHVHIVLEPIDSRLPDWARRLVHNPVWQENAKISAALWVLNFGLLYAGLTKWGHYGQLVNFALSLFWDTVWYFINRFHLWRGRKISTVHSTGHTFGGWFVTFALNNVCFWVLVTTYELNLFVAKPLLTGVSMLLGTVRFCYNDKVTFAEDLIGDAPGAEMPPELASPHKQNTWLVKCFYSSSGMSS